MSDDPKALLIEQAASAYRERDASGHILPSPAWLDLLPEEREAVFQCQLESRITESAVHPGGLSTTARAVLNRLR